MKILKYCLLSAFFHITYSQNQDFEDKNRFRETFLTGNSPYVSAYWTSLSLSPHSVSRSCCAYIELNGIPYLYQFGGGNTSSELRRVARLNLNTNQWQNNYSTMPHPVSSGTAITIGNNIYVFGGNLSPGSLGKTMKYDVYSNSWQTLSDMPTKVTDALVVKYDDTRIIIVGGGDGYFGSSSFKTNKVQMYNINTNSYTYLNDLPLPCAMLGGAIYRDTIITAGGYTTGGIATANCFKGVINPSNMSVSWSSIPNYPAGPIVRMASYIAVKDHGVGVMFTGGAIGGTTPTASTHFWSFCLQQWLAGLPDNSQPRSNFKACGRGNEKIYVTGGFTNSGVGTTEYITFTNIDGPCNGMVGTSNNSVASNFMLHQNYPNPFNSSTVISYSVPVYSFIKIDIYNQSGEKIKTALSSYHQAGNYDLTLNLSGMPSGVYFYTLQGENFRDTKKMVLVK
ncbi:MAG: T9SS type A sorting domain-containing protein [Ignavibacteria bacterium]|nr:T9SS type A sorting domain-containing protein [Ignavibacteria bacterium]